MLLTDTHLSKILHSTILFYNKAIVLKVICCLCHHFIDPRTVGIMRYEAVHKSYSRHELSKLRSELSAEA